ncbi:MAG: tetratricopeptide repeat protein [Alphaproteobacteria bacterium]
MMQSTDQTLTAFYDLQVAPVTFDFVVFLTLAEMARRRSGAQGLHVVILPGPAEGFRADDVSYDADNKSWRLHNIMLPALGLMETPPAVTLCRRRDEAAALESGLSGPVFPEGYRVAAPRGEFLWSGIAAAHARGESIPRLRATAQARAYMREWLAPQVQGRKTVTITLRESSHAPARNSDLSAWAEFAHSLDSARFIPVVIRDTEAAFGPIPNALTGFPLCAEAAIHLDLRLALYEQAHINLMVVNGPGILCWLSAEARFLMFKCANAAWANTRDIYWNTVGIARGGQIHGTGSFQRLVWDGDEPATIRTAFETLDADIGSAAEGTPAASSSPPVEPPFDIALRLYHAGRLEDALSIVQDLLSKEPQHADGWHLLGIIAGQSDRLDLAEKALLRSLQLNPRQGNVQISLGTVLRRQGRGADALSAYWKGVTLAPDHAGGHADLAEALVANGEAEEAADIMRQALALAPESIDLHDRAARLFDSIGHADAALTAFRDAASLRDARTERIRAQVADRPEISPLIVKSG